MIFYFTGTGNSLDAAMQLAGDDQMINITECVQKKQFSFSIEKDEKLGFVFPVYFGGLPSIVSYFIRKLKVDRHAAYSYGVITCGGDAFAAGDRLSKKLLKRGIVLDAVYTVKMPDNYILMYPPASDDERKLDLEASKTLLADIRMQIEANASKGLTSGLKARAMTAAMYPFYVFGRKTKKFWVDDKCVGCGTCAKRCPQGAIEMKNGKPVWVKDRCVQCLSCMRCGAIQYGKITADRARYTNPVLLDQKIEES